MADKSGYIGRSPGDASVTVARQTFQPTGIQTDFSFLSGYDPGYIDAYLNGARLVRTLDYSASDGSTVGLTSAAQNGDILELVAYKAFNLASINNSGGNFDVGGALSVTGISTFTNDLYVGGDLYVADDIVYDQVNGREINISGIGTIVTLNATTAVVGSAVTISATGVNVAGIVTAESSYVGSAVTTDSQGIRAAGIVTASSFVGDGANLTGIDATAVQTGTTKVQTSTPGISNEVGGLGIGTFSGAGLNVTGIVTAISAFVGAAVTTDSQGIRAAGVVTATSFVGDGSGLSGVESWNQQDTWLYGGG